MVAAGLRSWSSSCTPHASSSLVLTLSWYFLLVSVRSSHHLPEGITMTIAVTAATGHLGTLVVDALLDRTTPDQVVAVVRDAAKAEPLAAKGVAVRVASYDDPTALKDALAGVDQVLLISGSEVGQRAVQHRNVIDAAIANDVSRLVY